MCVCCAVVSSFALFLGIDVRVEFFALFPHTSSGASGMKAHHGRVKNKNKINNNNNTTKMDDETLHCGSIRTRPKYCSSNITALEDQQNILKIIMSV